MIVNQLTRIYLEEEKHHRKLLSEEDATRYFQRLLEKNHIIYHTHNGSVVGYVEVWRINYEQWGRIVCQEDLSAYTQDMTKGNIAYVADTWIDPAYRRGKVYQILKMKFFQRNFRCDYFCGEARRHRTGLIKIFKKDELMSTLFKNGGLKTNGK